MGIEKDIKKVLESEQTKQYIKDYEKIMKLARETNEYLQKIEEIMKPYNDLKKYLDSFEEMRKLVEKYPLKPMQIVKTNTPYTITR